MNHWANYSFIQYLEAKKSIDDRSLNRQVWGTLARQLNKPFADQPMRILEIGAGIGTMIERTFEWGLYQHAVYTAVDAHETTVSTTKSHLAKWAKSRGFTLVDITEDTLHLFAPYRTVEVRVICEDIFDFIPREKRASHRWDLIIAHAFLDLVDVPSLLGEILSLASEGGFFYFSLNFDGVSIFEPPIQPELDAIILELYHRSMDKRTLHGKPSGDSCTGRHLFHHLRKAGAQILEAGASDWVIFPRQGGYLPGEAIFLHYIIHTIATALQDEPTLEAEVFKAWIEARHRQVERGELVYIAHQLDFCGRVSP